ATSACCAVRLPLIVLAPSHAAMYLSEGPASTAIYTLSLHDALPICRVAGHLRRRALARRHLVPEHPRGLRDLLQVLGRGSAAPRSEEHTSELQSRENLVCRLLLEKKNNET